MSFPEFPETDLQVAIREVTDGSNKQIFLGYVAYFRSIHGAYVPKITDAIMDQLYPYSSMAAKSDGAYSQLRRGIKERVSRLLRERFFEPWNDLDDKNLLFGINYAVRELSKTAYFVTDGSGSGEMVDIPRLFQNTDKFESACRYLREKHDEIGRELRQLEFFLMMAKDISNGGGPK